MVRKQSNGNTHIQLVINNLGDVGFRISGTKPSKMRNNIYDALSDYGIGYDTAKYIVKLFMKEEVPEIRVNLLKEDFKGYDSKKSKGEDE